MVAWESTPHRSQNIGLKICGHMFVACEFLAPQSSQAILSDEDGSHSIPVADVETIGVNKGKDGTKAAVDEWLLKKADFAMEVLDGEKDWVRGLGTRTWYRASSSLFLITLGRMVVSLVFVELKSPFSSSPPYSFGLKRSTGIVFFPNSSKPSKPA